MEYIKKNVKGYKKSYVTSKGIRKNTKPNLSIYLGANTPFNPDDDVIIMDMELFNLIDDLLDLSDNTTDNIKDIIHDLKQFKTIEKNDTRNSVELVELKEKVTELQKELNIKNTEYDKLNDELHQFKNLSLIDSNKEKEYIKLIAYHEKIELVWENYNLFERIRNKNPKDNISIPYTPILDKKDK